MPKERLGSNGFPAHRSRSSPAPQQPRILEDAMSPSWDHKDDVDRLFACFKCGITPPESSFKERKSMARNESSLCRGKPPVVEEASSPQQREKDPTGKAEGVSSTSKLVQSIHHKQFSPIVFYGSPHGLPMKKPLKLLKLLHEIRIDLTEQKDYTKRKEVWATFPRQEEAVKFARTHSQVFVFSYQDHLNGQRRFLASTYDEFWRRYKNMNPRARHHYEVIQEGFPCHLYFDLEFDKRVNPDRDVDEMVDILVNIIFESLHEKYSIKGSTRWVIELESSTTEKFSRHLIFRIPRVAFKDNSHVGSFVSEICSRIAKSRANDPQLWKLYVKKDSDSDSVQQLFLDTGVYSRNRCFRLVFSSKAGKNSFLIPTGRFKCADMNEMQVFMESIICRMDTDCNRLLLCKLDMDFQKTLCFESEIAIVHKASKDIEFRKLESSLTSSTGRSPFPSMDEFVESIASSGNIPGRIRSWYWFSEYGVMVYSMSRNRYCERIGREHKSNHVMYVVDFQSEGYYQKCHDPDCAGYRSPMRPIPSHVVPDVTTLYDSARTECHNERNISCYPDLAEDSTECSHPVIMDSCKKDAGWWQEAIRLADSIESMRGNPKIINLGDANCDEDSDWWMDVEKLTTEIEQQTK